MAVDSAGNATEQFDDGTRKSLWANQYDTSNGWGTAVLVKSDDVDNAGAPGVGYDSDDNAHALWWQGDGTAYNIHTSRFVTSTGWTTPQLLDDDTGDAFGPKLAFSPFGDDG
ncbi:MAG: hypothetical protein GY811_10355 [Myxococcales bacterium]|nr:hypothetical protein [Myxococcales bacterium]